MPSLRAIRNHVIFQFEDDVVRKSDTGRDRSQFSETTDWGFEISNYDEGAKHPRWGIVTAIGPDVIEEVKVGGRVLIEALRWTDPVTFNSEKYWRTNDSEIMGIDEDYQ